MKQLSLRYDDEDHHKLKTAKEKTGLSWERFILAMCTEQKIKPFKIKVSPKDAKKFNKLKGGLDNGNKNNRS